jgi:F-type H+-transporting ATPase subunit b
MPQFNPEFFATQLFWLLVTFTVLYVLMATVALPKIGKVLDERQRRIDENLSKAGQLKAEAEAAIKAYEKSLADARAKAAAMVKERTEQLSKEAEAKSHEQGVRLAAQIKAGETRILEAKAQALAGVREVALEVAAATVARLLGTAPEQGQLDGAVTEALKEFGR